MLDRIDMHVIHMRLEIEVIANRVFPIPLLPEIVITATVLGQHDTCGKQFPRKSGFDQTHAPGVSSITFRQGLYRMPVVRQNHHGVDHEGDFPAHTSDHFAKDLDVLHQQRLPAVAQVGREEIRATGDKVAAIGHHGVCYPVIRFASYGLRLRIHVVLKDTCIQVTYI